MTDNGHAALAERLKPYQMPDPWTDDLRIVVMVGTAEEVAAAILAPRGVFLPDGLTGEDLRRSDFFDEQATTIAALRAALTVIEAEHSAGDHPEWAGWYGEPGERPDLACRTCGTFGEYAVHWPCDTAKIAHAALAAVKETP